MQIRTRYLSFCGLLTAAVSMTAAVPFDHALQLAASGHCAEALPLLANAFSQTTPDNAKRIGEAGAKCALALNDTSRALTFLSGLTRRFPHDPTVLYLATHAYSDLSVQASSELLRSAPGSVEARQLNAEALESMGKWNEARQEYEALLQQHPDTPGIHYRIGRILLSQPSVSEADKAQAKQEFEAELKLDPSNAGAEFVLAELARQSDDLPAAERHFEAAIRNDPTFFDAYLGLGRTEVAQEQYSKAIGPLEKAEKLQPAMAEVHFQLATAYRRLGRVADAARETKLHADALAQAQFERDRLHQQVTGSEASPASSPQ